MKCDELMKYGMDDPIIGDDYEMYRVADVDAAIDELKREHHRERHEYIEMVAKQRAESFKRERHHKYKRCLAMAEWCDAEADVADADGDYEDMRRYQKWHKRWLELAEMFK